jgi:hypothetical protein
MKCQFVETNRPWFGLSCDADAEWIFMFGERKRRICNAHFETIRYIPTTTDGTRVIGDSAYPIEDEEVPDALEP